MKAVCCLPTMIFVFASSIRRTLMSLTTNSDSRSMSLRLRLEKGDGETSFQRAVYVDHQKYPREVRTKEAITVFWETTKSAW